MSTELILEEGVQQNNYIVFTLRNIIQQSTKWNSTLFVNYVDFEKALNSIHRKNIWSIMKFYGIPDKLVRIMKLLYETMQCAVRKDGEETDWFRVTTGVKQDCTMSGFLFLLIKDCIMIRTTETEPTGIRQIFNTKRLLHNTYDEMELNWPCPKNAEHQNLCYRSDTASRRKKKESLQKTTWRRNTMLEKSQLRWNSLASERATAKDRARQRQCIRALGASGHRWLCIP